MITMRMTAHVNNDLQTIPQKLRLNRRSGWAVILGVSAAFCFGAMSPAGYSTARPPQEVTILRLYSVGVGTHRQRRHHRVGQWALPAATCFGRRRTPT